MSRCASRPEARVVIVLLLLIAAHLGIVSSIIWQDRPIIWPLHNDTIHRAGRGADFYAVYHAGLNQRKGIDPYANNADGATPYFYPYRYLPIVATAFQPLTSLSPQTAYRVWLLILEGVLALFLVTIWNRIPETGVRLSAIGLLLISSPYFLELYMGQFTFVSVTLCCLGLLLPMGQLLFCVSVLIKPLTLAALPALASQRRYWAHGASAILCVALVTVPYFVRHPEQWLVFFNENFRLQGGLHAGNYGFARLLQLLLNDLNIPLSPQRWDSLVHTLRYAAFAATSLLVLLSKRRSVLVGVPALLLAHFLTYQHVWEHHMSGVSVLAAVMLTARDRGRLFSYAILFSLLLLSSPTLFGVFDVARDRAVFDPSGQWPKYASYLIVLSKVIPTLTLYLCSTVYLGRSGLMSPLAAVRRAAGGIPS